VIVAEGRVSSAQPGGLITCRADAGRGVAACGDCGQRGACVFLALALSGRREAPDVVCVGRAQDHLRVGDGVEICLSARRALAAAVATYGVLLGCLGGSIGIATLLAVGDSDALTATASLIGLAVGVLALRLIERRHARSYLPVARRHMRSPAPASLAT
jgi:positive regulator of sigma E activity